MIKFFEYNWQVRDEWFDWCNQLTPNELIRLYIFKSALHHRPEGKLLGECQLLNKRGQLLYGSILNKEGIVEIMIKFENGNSKSMQARKDE